MEYAAHLWENKRWLFWLLLPVLLVLFGTKIYSLLINADAQAKFKKATEKDSEIQAKTDALAAKEAQLEAEIRAGNELLKQRDIEDMSLDWHKNYKPKD